MADETPLPIIAVLLGMGQPLGLWLLYELIGQYPRLLELSNLLTVLGYGGLLAIAVGGSLASLERRAGRLLSYASLYVMGFVLLDLARGTLASTAYGVVELFTRALGLALVAASVSLARSLKARGVRFAAVPVFILGMLTLAGLVPGVSLASRWNLLLELEATDRRAFVLVLVATLGVLIGTARFVMLWLRQIIPLESVPVEVQEEEVDALPPELPRLVRARAWVGAQLRSLGRRIQSRIPSPVQRLGRNVTTQWRAVSAMVLLATLTAFALYYSALPQVWLDRALETVGQLAFLR
jgi:formate hydrogenlyase subunit 3/multisubunit Na+/H+ antiporter MnhD subunit